MKFTILIFSIIYIIIVIMTSIPIHEYTHVYEYRNIHKINEDICFYNCVIDNERVIGYYSFQNVILNGDDNGFSDIKKTDELIAYSIQFIYIFIMLLALLVILLNIKNKQ